MKRTAIGLMISLLLSGAAWAADKKAPQSKPTFIKMSAEQVFAFVEQVSKQKDYNRSEAVTFLQKALDGKLRLVPSGAAPEASGLSVCIPATRPCQCLQCNSLNSNCHCSKCCIL